MSAAARTTGIALETLLYLAGAALVVSGVLDGMLLAVPNGAVAAPVIVLLTCLWAAVASGLRPALIGYRTVAALCVLALAAVHGVMGHPVTALAPDVLYFVVIVLCAATGSGPRWLSSVAAVLLVEGAAVAVHQPRGLLPWLKESLPSMGYLLSAGVVPYVVAGGLRQARAADAADASARAPAAGEPPSADAPQNKAAEGDAKLTTAGRPGPVDTGSYIREQLAGPGLPPGSDVGGILDSVVYFMRRNFVAYSALGFIYDDKKQTLTLNSFHSKSLAVIKDVEIRVGAGIIGRVANEKRSFLSGDLSLYGQEILYYQPGESVNSALAVPIISEDREFLGVLAIDSKEKRAFTDDHKEAMRRFSSLAAALVTNARMRIYQQKVAQQLQIFYETSQKFTTALKVDEVFEVLFQMTGQLTRFTRIMVLTVNEAKRTATVYKILGSSPDIREGAEFPLAGGIYSFAYEKRKIVPIGDLSQYGGKYFRFAPDEPPNPQIRSLAVVPILDNESRCLGLLSIESDIPNQFREDFEQIVSTLTGNASVALARAILYQKMERLATTDGLTELNNHRTFQELLAMELERSKRYDRSFSLLLMDIDHFKAFNDTYGHPVGDLVLKEIALCIRRSIRLNDIPARYGGEEFAVILPENNERGVLITAERIRQTVEAREIPVGDKILRVNISIGCAVCPLHASEKSGLIECADKALYYSKEHGRNRVTLYAAGM